MEFCIAREFGVVSRFVEGKREVYKEMRFIERIIAWFGLLEAFTAHIISKF